MGPDEVDILNRVSGGQVDRRLAAQWLDRSPETLKSWERRGRIRRAGVDRQGRVTYSVAELAKQAGRADARRGKATR